MAKPTKYTWMDRVTDTDIREAVEVARKVLPKRLKGLRESMMLTILDVAQEVGVTKEAISAYERGDLLPSLLRLIALAAFYGVTVDDLIWSEEARGR